MTAAAPKQGSKRLSAIDGLRGLVVVFMVLQHTVDAWVREPERQGWLWRTLRHLGGLPAPGFMLLAGLSAALVAARERQRGLAAGARAWVGVKRGLYVLGIGFSYRIVAFFVDGNHWDQWWIIFRVDILNAMGVSLAIVALACAWARTRRESIAIALGLAAMTLLSTPFIQGRVYDGVWGFMSGYVSGRDPLVLFALFPWFAFTAVGFAVGEQLGEALGGRDETPNRVIDRTMYPLMAAGLCIFSGGIWLGWMPFHLYPPHDYWNASPIYMSMRVGIQLALLGVFARLWRDDDSSRWSAFLQLLGRHSLFVYLVHLELVYGRVGYELQRALTMKQTLEGWMGLVLAFAVASWVMEWCQRWWRTRARTARPVVFAPATPVLASVPAEGTEIVGGQLDAG
jgi:uncharacterized membrane protein